MAQGAVFQLVTNNGKQDKLLTASEFLSKRISKLENVKLSDIEKTHVLFMNAHFKPYVTMAYEYNKVSLSNAVLSSQLQFSIPNYGDFFSDMVLHLVLEAPTASATGTVSDVSDTAVYRWCDWIGERICKTISFDVNGNPLDSYQSETYNMHRQFMVGADKMTGWARNMGQEMTQEGYFQYDTSAASVVAPAGSRGMVNVRNGYQTYRETHDDVSLFIPLLFWFNTDVALAIPSVAIPYGQRYITVDLADKDDLVRVIVNPSATNALTAPVITTPTIRTCELYINNIFVQPDIHDIFIKRIGFTLVRVHRRQTSNINKETDQILLQQLKWPIEDIKCGMRPTANKVSNPDVTTTGASDSISDPRMEDWHRFSQVSTTEVAANVTTGVASAYVLKTETNHVKTLTIQAYGIDLYKQLPAQFFNSYVPYHYGGWNIVTPTDPGLFMITFNLYPGSYQPSGHINLSRAREFYLEYDSSYVTSTTTADLVVIATAINFLLISDGSAIMRYST